MKKRKILIPIEGTEISTMADLTQWVVDSDKVVTF